MSKIIMGIQVEQRHGTVSEVQNVLTDFGCFIKTRLGLHQASDDRESCSEKGLIILELIKDADAEASDMEKALSKIDGVQIKKMEF